MDDGRLFLGTGPPHLVKESWSNEVGGLRQTGVVLEVREGLLLGGYSLHWEYHH